MRLPGQTYRQLVQAKLFIDDHFDEPLSLALVALQANMSAFHFHRLFTMVYRITPHQYITRKRVVRARQLLSMGNENVSVICHELGFESHGSFSTLFKKHIGISPQGYRNEAREKQSAAAIHPQIVVPACFLGMAGLK